MGNTLGVETTGSQEYEDVPTDEIRILFYFDNRTSTFQKSFCNVPHGNAFSNHYNLFKPLSIEK